MLTFKAKSTDPKDVDVAVHICIENNFILQIPFYEGLEEWRPKLKGQSWGAACEHMLESKCLSYSEAKLEDRFWCRIFLSKERLNEIVNESEESVYRNVLMLRDSIQEVFSDQEFYNKFVHQNSEDIDLNFNESEEVD